MASTAAVVMPASTVNGIGSGVAVGSSPGMFLSTASLGGTNAVNVRVFTGTFTVGRRFLPNGANSPMINPILSPVVTNNPATTNTAIQ